MLTLWLIKWGWVMSKNKKLKNKFHKRSTEDEEDFIFVEKDANNK